MLSTADRRVAETFKERLLTIVRPLDVRVFGSRARGAAQPDSDLDIYIEVEKMSPEVRTKISELAWDVGFDQDVVISTFVVTRDQIEHGMAGANPLVLDVLEEGQPV